ncbi:MAG: radical SAM family heme chaperone HemW [Clostridium perfringens]|nr:radical SAM family heme chaperone HemW [Clostridium perfringens]
MKHLGLYVHIPFCKQKCYYCDFASFSGKEHLQSDYIKALCKEIKETFKTLDTYIIDSIFIGGGTPSILDVSNMKDLFSEINKLNKSRDIEYSMECNPGSLNEEKLKVMKQFGINRISIGLQGVQNRLLKSIGRIHDFEDFKNNFNLAREYGFNNINVDLIFALPDQSLEEWKETLETICKMKPEHISAYSLIIEEGTAFYTLYEKGKISLPEEDLERDMYNIGKKILKDNGYNQYEISNYSLKGKECRHNLKYWDMNEWIGVGSNSSSFIDSKRIKNISDIKKYIENINKDEMPYEEVIKNTKKDSMEEFMFMGLRKIEGIDEKEFYLRFNETLDDIYKNVIKKYEKQELLARNKGRLYLTKKGMEVSNIIMADFLL